MLDLSSIFFCKMISQRTHIVNGKLERQAKHIANNLLNKTKHT